MNNNKEFDSYNQHTIIFQNIRIKSNLCNVYPTFVTIFPVKHRNINATYQNRETIGNTTLGYRKI